MKKIVALLLALILSLSLMSCQKSTSLPVVEDDQTTEQSDWTLETQDDDNTADAPQQNEQEQQQEVRQDSEQNIDTQETAKKDDNSSKKKLKEDGSYYSKEDVALYIHTYGHLPKNYISKKDAQNLGWSGGSLEPFAPGCCIGGSHFGNYEGILPEAKNRSYTECDIGTKGKKSRGAKRIVFSNDGLIFYTNDHYETFELLYGEVD